MTLARQKAAATLIALLCLAAAAEARLPASVTVRLLEAYQPVTEITLPGPVRINQRWVAGRSVLRADRPGGEILRITPGQGSTVTLILRQGEKTFTRQYAGRLTIRPDARRQRLIIENTLPTPLYVASVVSGETLPGWPDEMLKTQAVLTQTRLMQRLSRPLSDTTEDQFYPGWTPRQARIQAVIAPVLGWGLYRNRQLAPIFFHSTCAGHVSGSAYFSGKDSAAIACPHCKPSPFFKAHTATLPLALWKRHFDEAPPRIIQRDAAGRPLTIRWPSGRQESGYAFWLRAGQKLGWDKLPGTRYDITPQANAVTLSSRGAGHGVGLCQWGAAAMASQGKTHVEILHFYVPGGHLGRL